LREEHELDGGDGCDRRRLCSLCLGLRGTLKGAFKADDPRGVIVRGKLLHLIGDLLVGRHFGVAVAGEAGDRRSVMLEAVIDIVGRGIYGSAAEAL
jgi:hypothetical protein